MDPELIQRKRMIAYIKSSSGFLSEDNKKNILTIVMHEEGTAPIREYKERNCTSIDLDLITKIRTLERIYDIARSRRQNISIPEEANGQQDKETTLLTQDGRCGEGTGHDLHGFHFKRR